MTRTAIAKDASPSRQSMLGIYLNDHLAGATAGSELARRMTRSHRGQEEGGPLRRLAAEIRQDRSALLDIMASLGVTVRAYKVGAAWIGEKELELLRLGVEGKAAGWRTLRTQADADARLDAGRLDELISRAKSQVDELEELRVRAADRILSRS
jgi:hypothetical protein